jgi:hypothetical protein
VELTKYACSTQKPLQSELCVKWESFKRYLVMEAFQQKNLPLKLGRMKKSWVCFSEVIPCLKTDDLDISSSNEDSHIHWDIESTWK